ncbi:MAG: hypothetical protein JW969_14250 [Spirochaetales bacterium]|nr:hypothetical protein [Spirochaetales bacterium]
MGKSGSISDFDSLINQLDEPSNKKSSANTVQKPQDTFKLITKILGDPKPFFNDKDYYKKAISNEGEYSKKIHELLTQFLSVKDPQDRSIIRGRIIPAFWNLSASIASKLGQELPYCKVLLLRFGILSPSLLTAEQRNLISRVIYKNNTGEPVYYLDEWLIRIARGMENPSATDELKKTTKDATQKLTAKVDKVKSQKDAEIAVLRSKVDMRTALEDQLYQAVDLIRQHTAFPELDGLEGEYRPEQRKALTDVAEFIRRLQTTDRDIARTVRSLDNITQHMETLSDKSDSYSEETPVDSTVIVSEFNTLRQMSKLCVGRKGNHFPIAMQSYIRPAYKELGLRENIINVMASVEALDPGLFLRTFKGITSRIVPNVLLLPNYGEFGICWEPFERRNRTTSRGRLAIPLYPKSLRLAVICALGDLRWQVAKEKAQHHWMEEGITGKYYMWFSDKKLKGDVKEYFINDYILWITKESTGMQKLDREVRGIFWRSIPFPQKIKDNLKNRGFVYNELYKKDQNIAMSDGY